MQIQCPACRRVGAVPDEVAGRTVKCVCGASFTAVLMPAQPSAELPRIAPPVPPPLPTPTPPLLTGSPADLTPARTSGLAVAALVLGILGCIPLAGLVGLVLGIVALAQIKRSQRQLTGRGMAITGICLSAVLSFVLVVYLVGEVATIKTIVVKSNEKAHQATCTSNTRQLAMAVMMYAQDNKGRLPGLYKFNADGSVSVTYTGWAADILPYVRGGGANSPEEEMFYCPSTAKSDLDKPITYGYNGCLLNTDGTGVNEASIKSPTQVGVLCDSVPGIPFFAIPSGDSAGGGGGIIGGYSIIFTGNGDNLASRLTVVPDSRHARGTIIGYADGHAAMTPEKFYVKDSANGVTRAFYMAPALGLVDNPAAGLGGSATVNDSQRKNAPFGNCMPAIAPSAATVGDKFTTIGGDPVCRLILQAACEANRRVRPGFVYSDNGFTGCNPVGKNGTRYHPTISAPIADPENPADYLEGVGMGGSLPASRANCTVYPIATDAMVVIVNKNCSIRAVTASGGGAGAMSSNLSTLTPITAPTRGSRRVLDFHDLQTIFNSDGFTAIATTASDYGDVGYTRHDFQVYCCGPDDGTNAFLCSSPPKSAGAAGGFGLKLLDTAHPDLFRGVYCDDDLDIVDKVAADPLGIAIVSTAVSDQKRVDICAIQNVPNNGTPAAWTFPSSSVRVPADMGVYPPNCTWPFRRVLYAIAWHTGTTKGKVCASKRVGDLCFTPTSTFGGGKLAPSGFRNDFIKGPLYQASYWP